MTNRKKLNTHLCCLICCIENLLAGSYSSIPEKKEKSPGVITGALGQVQDRKHKALPFPPTPLPSRTVSSPPGRSGSCSPGTTGCPVHGELSTKPQLTATYPSQAVPRLPPC